MINEAPERVFLTEAEANWRTTPINDSLTTVDTIEHVRVDRAMLSAEEQAVIELGLAWHKVFGADLGADKLFAFRDACDALLAARAGREKE